MLVLLSASHKNSSFDVLEKLSVGADESAEGILQRHDAVSGAVVVATCNRFEAYLELAEPSGSSPLPAVYAAIDAVSASTGVPADTLRDTLELVHGNRVAEHLFAVTSGLESVVVGEGEIAGQVRRSLEFARAAGTTSPELERLFQRASQTSRGVNPSFASRSNWPRAGSPTGPRPGFSWSAPDVTRVPHSPRFATGAHPTSTSTPPPAARTDSPPRTASRQFVKRTSFWRRRWPT